MKYLCHQSSGLAGGEYLTLAALQSNIVTFQNLKAGDKIFDLNLQRIYILLYTFFGMTDMAMLSFICSQISKYTTTVWSASLILDSSFERVEKLCLKIVTRYLL